MVPCPGLVSPGNRREREEGKIEDLPTTRLRWVDMPIHYGSFFAIGGQPRTSLSHKREREG